MSASRGPLALVAELRSRGIDVEVGKHYKARCPGGLVVLSATTNGPRWFMNVRAQLKRAGVDLGAWRP